MARNPRVTALEALNEALAQMREAGYPWQEVEEIIWADWASQVVVLRTVVRKTRVELVVMRDDVAERLQERRHMAALEEHRRFLALEPASAQPKE